MSEELEPCPFCEREPQFQEWGGGYRVTCTHCDIHGGWGDYGFQAADKWNAAAKAIEARRAETLGSVHESAGRKALPEKDIQHD